MNIEDFSCPLGNSEKKAVKYIDFVSLRIKVNGKWIPAIFKDGKIHVKEEAYKSLFS